VQAEQFFVCSKPKKNGSGEINLCLFIVERALRAKQDKGLPHKVNKGLRIQYKMIPLNHM